MNTASLELSKTLYELSGWESDDWFDLDTDGQPLPELCTSEDVRFSANGKEQYAPAYDLGFILRRLPDYTHVWFDIVHANAWAQSDQPKHTCVNRTPEDAACQLAIELFKQGILKRETLL